MRRDILVGVIIVSIVVTVGAVLQAWQQRTVALRQTIRAATAQAETGRVAALVTAEAEARTIAQAEANQAWAVATIEAQARSTLEAEATSQAKNQAETEAQLQAVDEQRLRAEALWLAGQSDKAFDNTPPGLIRSTLLAVESMRQTPTFEGDQALRRGLDLLPRLVTQISLENYVEAIAFSPDGQWLATGSWDGVARVWDLAAGQEVGHMKHPDKVLALTFSPNGQWLATLSGQTAYVWDAATGQEISRLEHESRVRDIAFSPDGQLLATASWDDTARLWNPATGQETFRLAHQGDVYTVDFSPDGQWLATGSWDNTARIWEVKTGREVARLEHDGPVFDVSFGAVVEEPAGQWIATASRDGTARLWLLKNSDPENLTLAEIARLEHTEEVRQVMFTPDGKWLGTISGNAARVWQIRARKTDETTDEAPFTVQEVTHIEHDGEVYQGTFSPDGRWLATACGDNTARIWEFMPPEKNPTTIGPGREMARLPHTGPVDAVRFSPDGHQLATISGRAAQVWEADTGVGLEVARLKHDGPVATMTFSQDGQQLTTASKDRTVRRWDVATGEEIDRLEVEYDPLALSPDGRLIATGLGEFSSVTPTLQVWDVTNRRKIFEVKEESNIHYLFNAAAFDPQRQRLAVAKGSYGIDVWETATGKQLLNLGKEYYAVAMTFSPDGQQLAIGESIPTVNYLGSAKIWRLAYNSTEETISAQEVAQLDHDGPVASVAFSPDSQWLATGSGDGTARIWESATGQEIFRLPHGGYMSNVVFNADGELLAVSDKDSIRIWQFTVAAAGQSTTPKEIARLKRMDGVYKVVFSPDSQFLALAGGSDNTARIWRWQPPDLIEEACTRLPRNLTREEWQTYLDDVPYKATCPNLPVPAEITATVTSQAAVANEPELPEPFTTTIAMTTTLTPMPQPVKAISPENATQVRELARRESGNNINRVLWSPDNQLVVMATQLGVAIYRAEELEPVRFIETTSAVRHLALSAEGDLLAVGLKDGRLQLWQMHHCPQDPENCGSLRYELHTLSEPFTAILFSPTEPILATVSTNVIQLWRAEDGTLLRTITDHASSRLAEIAFSPDGDTLASISMRSLALWQVHSGDLLHRLAEYNGQYSPTIRFSPDGSVLASALDEGVSLWQVSAGTLVHTLPGGHFFGIAFSPDGAMLAGIKKNTVCLWSVSEGTVIDTLARSSSYHLANQNVTFSPDGITVLAGGSDDQIGVWRIADSALAHTLQGHLDKITQMAFSPDGTKLMTTDQQGMLRVWRADGSLAGSLTLGEYMGHLSSLTYLPAQDARSPEVNLAQLWRATDENLILPQLYQTMKSWPQVAFSPDGKFLISWGHGRSIKVWREADGTLLQTLDDFSKDINQATFSADGSRLAVLTGDHVVRFWNVSADGALQALPAQVKILDEFTLNANGSLLATWGLTDTVELWSTIDGTRQHRFGGHRLFEDNAYYSVMFSPQGDTLATTTLWDDRVRLWQVSDGALLRTLEGQDTDRIVFSPDGATLATTGMDDHNIIQLWRANDGTYLNTLHHTSSYGSISVAFSPDNTVVATGCSGDIIYLWRASDGGYLHTLTGHTGNITNLAFSTDGTILISTSVDGTRRMWGLHHTPESEAIQPSAQPKSIGGGGGKLATKGWYRGGISPSSQGLSAYMLEVDGDNFHAVGGSYWVKDIAWSPDGEQLAILENGSYSSRYALYLVDANGENKRLLTDVPAYDFAWSPDGHQLAIGFSGYGQQEGLHVMNIDGTELHRVPADSDLNGSAASWSPDGRQIAFHAYIGEDYESHDIYVVDVDGGNLRQLTHHPANDLFPKWSPNGQWIAFLSDRDDKNGLYVMGTDGSNLRLLAEQVQGVERDWHRDNSLAWSPDSRQLLFRRGGDIYVIGADGSNMRNLTGQAGGSGPAWSPDGTLIAFHSSRDGGVPQIFVMDRDGSNVRQLTHDYQYKWDPLWQP
jgi:WD40 repeat protein